MTLSNPTVLSQVVDVVDDNDLVTGTISPTANALLIAVVYWFAPNADGMDLLNTTETFGVVNTEWTSVIDTYFNYSGSFHVGIAVFTNIASSSPGSGVLTARLDVNCNRKIMHLFEVTGYDTDTPIIQSKTNTSTASTLTVTLDSSPAANSMVLAAVASVKASGGDIVPGSGFTELAENNTSAGAFDMSGESMYDNGGADTTADWSSLGTSGNIGAAIEIASEAVAGNPWNAYAQQ